MRKAKNIVGISQDDVNYFIKGHSVNSIGPDANTPKPYPPADKWENWYKNKMLKMWRPVKDKFLTAWNNGENVYSAFRLRSLGNGVKKGTEMPYMLKYEKDTPPHAI